MPKIADALIIWMRRRAIRKHKPYARRSIVTFAGNFSFSRYEPFWRDEGSNVAGEHWNRPPWWRPFNILLHCWDPDHEGEEFHDHPRWSITICLKGKLLERTPWAERWLTPGSIVCRSRKAIHAFYVEPKYRGKTWTIFIVGRRNYPQNRYMLKDEGRSSLHREANEKVST